ncbi:MAG TPA: DMT family transporter [candidate division Zixibacteria bacterium]|nr:DMT family transporter [candidate division Zixibacteria bacterium]MDD4916928.1 DMT family transporter [candidate division Zixibacteria bacterium]MDM7973073.1 DMT family transporter [candidate division Zixibacteria bacterium]HOD66809.1 DMT family transporter [candidate division Zixibacteria bacterium]HPM36365.1 DMT family transporter [candidate division Zixibacteria bacterium]
MIRLLLVLTVCVWGWSFVATKICLAYLTPLQVIGLRYLLGLPVMGAVLLAKRRPIRVPRAEYPWILAAAAAITIHFLVQVIGMQYTTATNTGWLIAVTPLVLAVLSAVFLKERLSAKAAAGIAVATTGVLLLVSQGRLFTLGWLQSAGDWLVFASAHTWAVFTILTRDLSRRCGPLVTPFLVLSVSAAVILTLMFGSAGLAGVTALPVRGVVALLFLGLVVQGLAFWFWQEGVAKLGAARAGVFLYLEPLATTALAVPYLGEHFGLFTGIGGGLVLLGVYLAERRVRRGGAANRAGTLESR